MTEFLCQSMSFGSNWYSAVGLALDLVGALYIFGDWALASRSEEMALKTERIDEWSDADVRRRFADIWGKEMENPFTSNPKKAEKERLEAMRRMAAVAVRVEEEDRRFGLLRIRRKAVRRAAVLIISGLFLQLFGSWPTC